MKIVKSLRERISISEVVYLLLIYLSMYVVLLGVELVIRGTSVEVLHHLVFWGVLAGWLLGRSSLKFWLVVSIGLLSGFLFTFIYVSGINTAIGDLSRSSIIYLWRLIFSRVSDTSQLLFHLSVILARASEVFSELSTWTADLFSGFIVYNQISTLIFWGVLMGAVSSWYSWVTIRKGQPIWGILPAGTMLAILMTYTYQKRFTLVLLLGAGLILIGMVNHDLKRQEWKKKGVRGADDVRERLYLVVVGLSLLTMVFAGIMPSIRIKPIADRFERLVYGSNEGGENTTGGSIDVGEFSPDFHPIQRFPGLPRQKLIGSGPQLSKQVVMIISYPAVSFVGSNLPRAARYWRSYSYDKYTGSGWQSSPTDKVSYQPGQEISGIYSDSFEIVTQEIRLGNAVRGTLYSAGPPVTLDHEAQVFWRTEVEEDIKRESQTIGLADMFAVSTDSLHYQVRSLVSSAGDEELRNAEEVVPEWINERYLQLPETVPERVRELAREIIANQPTRYDQAKAIEAFLRSYPYTLQLPAPPLDWDIADYFLFELQTGYCDYYATSMVVLARSVDLPARLVVGYASGQYDRENDYFLVSEADAHSWVEIYFSGYGWIPFEPTAARSLIDDEELVLPLPPELESLPQVAEGEVKGDFPWWQAGLGTFILAVLAYWLSDRADLARLKRMDPTRLILTIYLRVFRYARWMRIGHRKSDSMYEFNTRMQEELEKLKTLPRMSKRLAGVYSELNQLTEHAVMANYSRYPLQPDSRREIIQTWKSLRLKLRYAIWFKFWQTQGERLRCRENNTDELELIEDGAADGTR
jgi:transglutaminase-like putative cysteine protease